MIKLCVENTTPCVVYGDMYESKTRFVDKLLVNKYDFTKVANCAPNAFVYDNLLKQAPFFHTKPDSYIVNFVFVDDLNASYACPPLPSAPPPRPRRAWSSCASCSRRVVCTTRTSDRTSPSTTSTSYSYAYNASSHKPLSQRLCKHVVPVHLIA
jgi:hypothetical protein